MCTNIEHRRKIEAYESALLEIAALGNSPQTRIMYARPVAIAERTLEAHRRPEDLNLLGVDLAAEEADKVTYE